MNITKQQCIALDNEITTAVNAILEKHGLQTSKRRSNYGDLYRFTVEAVIPVSNENGVNTATPEAQAWIANGPSLGFKNAADALGTEFTSGGKKFRLTGYRTRARTRPILAQGEDGKTYIFSAAILRQVPGYNAEDDYGF